MRTLPTGTVTFLFTDIEASTRLLHELGPDDYADALAHHREIVRSSITAHGGVEVDTQGDAFFIAFPDAGEATAAAEEARRALAGGPIQVRMGLHTGEPTVTDEGYVGVDVHEGARIAAAGHGGQIICSRRTKELAGDAFAFIDLGEHRLKDMPEPVWIFQLGDGTFPPLKTLSNTNLPTPASSFLGRERELAEAAQLLERSRVMTIVGPGGAGKTRFSIELASRQLDRFPNGVFWVPLATVRDATLVIETAAKLLGTKTALGDHIGDRTMMLLLDNLEQVIDASPSIADLAEACPNLTILVTSRELMRVRGEHPYSLPPLDIGEGVQLFIERAGVAASDAVTDLARRLEGLPLAIELAAARASVMTPEQLLGRLGDRLDLLKGGRDTDPRQQTLRATIEWSHDLLSDTERRAFARLAVFAGGWTLDSAHAVSDVDVDTIQSLVDKSLIRRTGERFWMLETIREFAVERFDASGESTDLQRRHGHLMLDLAESAHLGSDATGTQRHQIVIDDQDNMRAALRWALTVEDVELGLKLTSALENFWVTNNPAEAVRWFERFLECPEDLDPSLHARALLDLGGVSQMAGQTDLADRCYAESLERYRAIGDELKVGEVLHRQGTRAFRSNPRSAVALLEESLRIALAVGNRWGECQVLSTMAHVARYHGDIDRAVNLLERSATLAVEIGNTWWEANTASNLGELDILTGRMDRARKHVHRALTLIRQNRDRLMMPWGLLYAARIAIARGEPAEAGFFWGAVQAEKARGAGGADETDPDYIELMAPIKALDDPAFATGVIEGAGSQLEEALDRAQTYVEAD